VGSSLDKAWSTVQREVADALLLTRVRVALLENLGSDGLRVEIEARDGIVELSGKVEKRSSEELAELARAAFVAVKRPPDAVVPPGTPPLGEAREIATRPYLSILGTNPRFHSPDDRWPYGVDLPKTSALCEALVSVARQLAR